MPEGRCFDSLQSLISKSIDVRKVDWLVLNGWEVLNLANSLVWVFELLLFASCLFVSFVESIFWTGLYWARHILSSIVKMARGAWLACGRSLREANFFLNGFVDVLVSRHLWHYFAYLDALGRGGKDKASHEGVVACVMTLTSSLLVLRELRILLLAVCLENQVVAIVFVVSALAKQML